MGTGKGNTKPYREFTRELHTVRQRNGRTPQSDDELDYELQRYWLATVPGYREVIKARISDARRVRARKEARLLQDIDRLGREVEGCG